MVRNPPAERNLIPHPPGWSNRILLLALAGICFLTLYPFRFTLQASLPDGASPFLLSGIGKATNPLDAFLNILLFIPFGFGLSEKLREKGWTLKGAFFATWIAGALLSYLVEFLQLYIPARDSGWEDILTNGTGAAIGSLISVILGSYLVGYASRADWLLRDSLTPWRTLLLLTIYFGVWFAVSSALQGATRLSDWNPRSQLLVGGELRTWISSPWQGTVPRLQFWNRPVSRADALALTSGDVPDGAKASLLADFDFSSSTPLEDRLGFLPPFSWMPHPPALASPQGIAIDSHSWLVSSGPVSDLIEALQKTNQFSLRVVCTPKELSSVNERIISIVGRSGDSELRLEQDNAHLVFWFRNPLSAGRSIMSWNIPNTFVAGQPRDILFSYDGSNLSLYINGTKNPQVYSLGPGTRLAEFFRRVRPTELSGYNFVYEALIFFPAGALIGMAATRKSPRDVAAYVPFVSGFLLPPLLYEGILSRVSGRAVSFESVLLCLILAVAGSLWINADRQGVAQPARLSDGTTPGGQPEPGNTG